MNKKPNQKKKPGRLVAGILALALTLCLLPLGRTAPIEAYTAAQRSLLKAEDLSVSRARILGSAAAHVNRANQVGYGFNRVLNGDTYIPLAASSHRFCCVDLVGHVVYTATASWIGGVYHTLDETLACSHLYANSNGLVFNTQTVSVLKSHLQGIPNLYSSLSAGISPSQLMLGDIVLMGDKDSSVLNHAIMVLGKLTAAENAYMNIPGFSANTPYFINMSPATGATYQSTDRLNKAWSSSDPTKGYFIKAVFRPLFPIRQQDLGGFRLKKTDDKGAGLAGAEFLLTGPGGSKKIVMTSSVYESGKIHRPGLYTLKETKAPPGCILDSRERSLTIGMDGINSVYWDTPIRNETDEGRVRIIKKDAGTGQVVTGAVFDLSQSSSFPASATQRLVTGADGSVTSTGLLVSAGSKAYIREAWVPPPYLLDAQIRQVSLVRGQTVSLEVANSRARGRIRLVKRDSVSGWPLEGVAFEIRGQDGTRVAGLVTDHEGVALSDDLPLGSYLLHETGPKEGYRPSESPWPVALDYQDQDTALFTREIELDNEPIRGKIKILKTDQADGSPIGGAVFELLDEKRNAALDYLGQPVPLLVSDREGMALTPDLRQGTYFLRELEAPQDYYLDPEDHPVAIRADGETEVLELQNERVMIYIQLNKLDAQSSLPLAGARFRIFRVTAGQPGTRGADCGEEALAELVTDEQGRARTTRPLPAGNYRLVEVQPPPGYSSGQDQDFHISRESGCILLEGGYKALDLQLGNEPVRLEFSKKRLTGQEELPGAHLQLIDPETGAVLEQWVSGQAPHLISGLHAGKTYSLREIKAPPGYALCDDMVFTVEDTAETRVIEMRDGLTRLLLRKEGQETKEALSGAGFELYDQAGRALDFVRDEKGVYWWKPLSEIENSSDLETDARGQIEIRGLPAGPYSLLETRVPGGYIRPANALVLTLPAGASAKQPYIFQVRNSKASLVIVKVDGATGRRLAGAVLDLFNSQGVLIQSGQTDQEGRLTITGLSPGDYTVSESRAPAGYRQSEQVLRITIDESGQARGDRVFENRPQGVPPAGELPLAYIPGLLLLALAAGIFLPALSLWKRKTKA